MHWIKVHFTCPNCYNRMKDSWMSGVFDRCCTGKPKDKMCKPDHATRNDVDDIQGCETYRFAFGLDEMAINAEMGLYFKFDEVNGIPVNCKGLKDFNMETWKLPSRLLVRLYLNNLNHPANQNKGSFF